MLPASMPLQRNSRRRTRTRTAIMDAGQKLFALHAIDSVSIDDIVGAADVAKGSFYNHFDDKEQLANAIVELVQGDSEFHVYTANRGITDPAERMARAFCVIMDYGQQHPDRLQALISLSGRRTADAPLNTGVAGDIRDGLAAGCFIGITVETGVLLALSIIRRTVTHAIAEPASMQTEELARQVGAGLLRALGVTEPRATKLADAAVNDILTKERTR